MTATSLTRPDTVADADDAPLEPVGVRGVGHVECQDQAVVDLDAQPVLRHGRLEGGDACG